MATAKFKLGDRLWHIQQLQNRSFVQHPFDVLWMSLDHNEVCYSYTNSYAFYEINCFASEAEARAECEKRNAAASLPQPVKR